MTILGFMKISKFIGLNVWEKLLQECKKCLKCPENHYMESLLCSHALFPCHVICKIGEVIVPGFTREGTSFLLGRGC